MTEKSDFNAEEWSQVLAGPPAAGMRVAIADRGGTIRESLAMGRAYQDARGNHGESALLDQIVSEQPSLDPREFQGEADVPGALTGKLQEALAVLDAKADPADVEAYKAFVADVAHRVATAKKEGGVLGIGGKEISEEEQAALDELTNLLGTAGATLDPEAAEERGDE